MTAAWRQVLTAQTNAANPSRPFGAWTELGRAGSSLPLMPGNRNSSAWDRVLLDRVLLESHACRTQRTVNYPSILEEASRLSLGVSIFLLVVGAILSFAVNVTTSGFNINTVGVILMVAGALGLVLSLLFWSSFSPYRRSRTVAGPDTVVEERRIERDLP
jgi:hypothetical protein